MKTCILWFRNNLRIGDNWPVVEAYTHYDLVIPVFIDEGSQHNQKWAQGPRGEYREAFLIDSLIDLNAGLMTYDSELLVLREKDAIKTLQSLAIQVGAMAIIGPKEFAFNEVTQENALEKWGKLKGLKIKFYNERTLFLQSDLPFPLEALPDVFSRFRGKVEKYSSVRAPIEEADVSPFDPDEFKIKGVSLTKPEIYQDDRSAVPFKGGYISAWEELDYYFWESEKVLEYKQTRNGLLGRGFSSKFSPFLALGCLSARQIISELNRFEEEVESNESTYWLFFELLWREYFQWIALKHGKDLFVAYGLKPEKPIEQGFNARAFEKWTSGNTGDKLVDSNMKELAQTGFMSNRGRQNVASYLVHDMGIDWRAGAAYFEQHLIDYDPASNYGNWLYNAGRGNDPRPFRKFNTKVQAERYDAKSEFVNTWS